MLGANALRGGAIAALAALVAAHALTLTELVVLSAVVGVGDAFFYPAYRAIMPELLPAELLTQGNAFNSASQTIGASFLGPAIGGVIVAAGGTSTAFAIDAGTFVVSALCLLMMAHVPAPALRADPSWPTPARASAGRCASAGSGTGSWPPGWPTSPRSRRLAVTIPLIVRDALHQGPAAYGATFAAGGAGGLLAAVVAGRLGSPRRRMSVIWAAWAAASVALAGVGVAPDVFVVAICGAITYFGLTYGNLLWGALMQLAVPAQMLGRASSVDWLFSICLSPLGLVFAGALASSIGVRETVLVGAGLSALSCLVVFVPGVRDPERADYAPVPLPEEVNGAVVD